MDIKKLLKVLHEMENVKSDVGDAKSYLLVHAIIDMIENPEVLDEYCEIYEVE
jgi:hypothetical protein